MTMVNMNEGNNELNQCDAKWHDIKRWIRIGARDLVDLEMLDEAYEFAKEKHGNQRRKSGDLYLWHPLAVAEILAKVRVGNDVLCAGILHDTMEDCGVSYEEIREKFNGRVAEIVKAVSAAQNRDNEELYAVMPKGTAHELHDRSTHARLINTPFQRQAFMVRFADRIHNLSTIMACSDGKRREKIADTRDFLIPAANSLGMRWFAIQLEDLCMKFDGDVFEKNLWHRTSESRKNCITGKDGTLSGFDRFIRSEVFLKAGFKPAQFNPFTDYINGTRIETRMRRLLTPFEVVNQQPVLESAYHWAPAMWEVLLTADESGDIYKQFITCFHSLSGNSTVEIESGVNFFHYGKKEIREAITIRMKDRAGNRYRVVIVPKDSVFEYFLGPVDACLPSTDAYSPKDALRPQIQVFSWSESKGYREYWIPAGATALDFAFQIRPELALTIRSARIHKIDNTELDKGYTYSMGTRLDEGDIVHFDCDYRLPVENGCVRTCSGEIIRTQDFLPEYIIHNSGGEITSISIPHVNVSWFHSVTTDRAKTALIRYLMPMGK